MKRKKVLLVNPRKGWRPALGLLYIATYVRQAGYEVKVIEFIDENFFPEKNKKLWREFYEFNPDVIGFGVISWNRGVTKDIIKKIRQTTVGKIIVCGGKDPSYKPDVYFDFGADFVVIGEGEETMVELLSALDSRSPLEEIKGIAYMKDGRRMVTEPRKPMNTDKLFFPAFDLVDYDQYCNIRFGGVPGHFIKTGFLIADRGCPYLCRFCTDPMRLAYRQRPIDNIIDEIKCQIKNWKVDGIVIVDDIFYFSDKRMNEFCEKLLREGLKIKLYALTRPDRVGSRETLALMKKAGFIQLGVGVESGSQRMLDIMKKGTNLDQIHQSIERINEAGMHTFIFLITGFPEETREDLELTAELVKNVKPTFTGVSFYTPMPGTPYYKEENEEDLENLSYSFTENRPNFASPVPHDDIIRFRNKFLSLSQRNKELNLLRYPSFYVWALKLTLFNSGVILKGIRLQREKKRYPNYFDAIRTAMINYSICNRW